SKLIIRIVGKRKTEEVNNDLKITRITFLTKAGLILAAIPFGSFIYGMTSVKFNFRIKKINLQIKNLPDKFSGLSIVHISDLHMGSLYGHHEKIAEAVKMINSLSPDIICFTGDMVNDFAGEMNGWFEILGKMEARIGKYSILGNHDYGDYHYWSSDEKKKKNLEMIKQAHHRLGFKLLLNKSITLTRQDNSIAIIGVENWGKPPFAQYGDLDAACKGMEKNLFKILLTHDPSHWDAEVLNKKDIPLTLSGHTHGMQFGVNTGKIKWSPIQLKYPRWIGLYTEGEQLLYVNPGLGYIGYPGRVGISPEITFIKIKRKAASIMKQPLSKSV
ncbi:MAG: metallophosphoesterase, partial [Bacteroidetes bacterium]|nr:metallophosphoesterase [Bacteroidota bacterium]